MAVGLNPYLNFRDETREAMEFYKTVFGGKLEMTTFKEFGASGEDQSEDDKIMHAALTGDNGITFFASDTPKRMEYKPGRSINMSLSGDDEALLSSWFEMLSDGGTTTMPLEKAAWGDIFGMCIDKFGISWMVNIAAPKEAATSA
jgi:PhnB protein